jgi:peptidoglycan/LPS O-acetylase OafA/YrhL
LGYVGHNVLLRIDQSGVAGTLHGVPFLPIWNGSLWTLYFEFGCYLLLGALALVGLLRHRWAVAVIAVAVWILEVVIISVPSLNGQFSYLHHTDWSRALILVPVFLVGSLLFLYRDVIPDSGWLALGSTILLLVGLVLPLGSDVPPWTLTSLDFTAIFLAYPLLWLGIHLPLHKVGARNDYSYGLYIYAWPVQQLLALWGVYKWGYVPYTALALLGTAVLAVASWWLVEKRALSLKKMSLPGRLPVTAAETLP